MADTLLRGTVLQSRLGALARTPPGVTVAVDADIAMADLRVPAAGVEAAGGLLGVALPVEPNTWTATPDGQLIWLGPDEWLLSSAREAPEALEARLRDAVVPLAGAAVDVSAQRLGIRLRGPLARDLLTTGCPIDLHPTVFRAGRCAQTTLGRVGIVLLALDEGGEDYRLLVRPSFAGHVVDWLLDAAGEYT